MKFVNLLIANCAVFSAVLIATPAPAQEASSTAQPTVQTNSGDARYQALEQQYLKQLQQNEQAQQEYQNQKDAYNDATQAKSAAQERVTVNAPSSYKPFDMKECPDGDDNNCRLATCVAYMTRDGVINICQSHGYGFP